MEKVKINGEATRTRIIRFILESTKERGFSPTFREISVGAKVSSTSSVHFHLSRLRDMGIITFKDGSARTIVVTQKGHALFQLPPQE